METLALPGVAWDSLWLSGPSWFPGLDWAGLGMAGMAGLCWAGLGVHSFLRGSCEAPAKFLLNYCCWAPVRLLLSSYQTPAKLPRGSCEAPVKLLLGSCEAPARIPARLLMQGFTARVKGRNPKTEQVNTKNEKLAS